MAKKIIIRRALILCYFFWQWQPIKR